MPTTIPAKCRTYDTQTAASILGVSRGLLYKIARAGNERPEYDRYGCQKIGTRVQWSKAKIDAATTEGHP